MWELLAGRVAVDEVQTFGPSQTLRVNSHILTIPLILC